MDQSMWGSRTRSTRSAVDIFNTLPIFTKEPIREEEIKLECMNKYHAPQTQDLRCDVCNLGHGTCSTKL